MAIKKCSDGGVCVCVFQLCGSQRVVIVDLGTAPQRVEIVNLRPFEDDESREQDLTSSPTNTTTENRCVPRVCVCVCVYTVCYWSSSVKVQIKICERSERDLQDTYEIKIDDPSCLSCPINSCLFCLWIGVWPILLAVASRLLSLRRRARSRGRRNLTLISKPPERRSWRRVRIPPTSWRRTTRNTATTTTTCWLVREDSIHHRCRCDLHGQNTCVCPNWDHISC